MKIMIIGHSGEGKSTLAKQLAAYYAIDCLHLDRLAFTENWQLRDDKAIQQDLERYLEEHSDWIIDGLYSKHCLSKRLKQADYIIIIRLNRFSSLIRILKRYLTYRGKNRPDTADGCPEQLDWKFLYFALFKSRRSKRQKLYKAIIETYPNKVQILTSQKAITSYINSLPS